MKSLFTTIIVFVLNQSFACTCEIRGELNIRDYHQSDVITLGTVINIQKNTKISELEYNDKEITLKIKEFFKGNLENTKILTVYTSWWDASCGLGVDKIGTDWIIFARKNGGLLYTSMCTPSKLIKNQDDTYLPKLRNYKGAEGLSKFFNDDKSISAEGKMINQISEGFWTFYPGYLSNHQTGYFRRGIKDSIWTTYGLKGKIAHIENYKEGLKHGAVVRYNGQNDYPEVITYYKNGKREGKVLMFYHNGILMIEGTYKDNRPVGEWKAYDEHGNTVCTRFNSAIWRNGNIGFNCE